MAKKITSSSAPIAEETGTDVLGTALDAATPPVAASDPSGMNGPDGTVIDGSNIQTGSIGGFPAEAVTASEIGDGTVTADQLASNAITASKIQAGGIVASASVPALLAGGVTARPMDGAVVDIPQGTDGGTAVLVAGAADPVATSNEALDLRALKYALDMTGCTDIDDLIDKATVGLSLLRAIDTHAGLGPLQGWHPMDDPAEIVGDLVKMASELQTQISALRVARIADVEGARPAYTHEKRRFILTGRTRQNNVLKDIGDTIDLTIGEHAELLDTLAIASTWDEGFEV
ncbi:hypothetical protein [Rhizobium sp. 9140]|uniref:hypothetical protein n=1 Tax=Rhizobium sp. 9140 TaxID=1761900 RepID=UPI000792602E|nr:hypothetical protein [Rhizobium sp. 9140]CZT36364.1 hypothetical protein GA0004734_00033630 [Rhizobium sp. 9140]